MNTALGASRTRERGVDISRWSRDRGAQSRVPLRRCRPRHSYTRITQQLWTSRTSTIYANALRPLSLVPVSRLPCSISKPPCARPLSSRTLRREPHLALSREARLRTSQPGPNCRGWHTHTRPRPLIWSVCRSDIGVRAVKVRYVFSLTDADSSASYMSLDETQLHVLRISGTP